MVKMIVSILVYVVLTFLAASGGLEVAALRAGLAGLAWPVGPRYRRLGYLLAGLLIAIAFFGGLLAGLLVEPLSPLLAVVVIFFAMALAVAAAVVGAAARLRWGRWRQPSVPRPGKQVDLGPMQAFFYQPIGDGPVPGICLLPDPTAPDDDLDALAQALVESGIAVLLLDWQSLGSADRLTLQGLVAVGFSHLARWPEINAGRVGLLGIGVGGDLALRSAAMDQGVAAVLAIEPVLSAQRPWQGLEALSDLSWFEARRRVQRWRRSELVKSLDALTAIPSIAPRSVAVIVGCGGGSEVAEDLQILRDGGGCFLVPAARRGAVQRATAWFKEHLA
jgi:dienelactone hydrolase